MICHYISRQASVTVRDSVGDKFKQIRSVDNEDVQIYVRFSRIYRAVRNNVRYSSLVVRFKKNALWGDLAVNIDKPRRDGYIRAVSDMIFDHVVQIDVAYNVAVGKNDIIRIDMSDRIINVFKRFETRRIYGRDRSPRRYIRRNDLDTSRTSCKIPVLARSDMIHQRLIIILCDYSYIGYIWVDHIWKGKIYKPVFARERYGSHCPVSCEFGDIAVMYIWKNDPCRCHNSLPFV